MRVQCKRTWSPSTFSPLLRYAYYHSKFQIGLYTFFTAETAALPNVSSLIVVSRVAYIIIERFLSTIFHH